MSALTQLPNVGKVLEQHLLAAGIKTPEQLREIGAKEALVRIRLSCDPGACIQELYALECAIRGMKDTLLPVEVKQELRDFHKTL